MARLRDWKPLSICSAFIQFLSYERAQKVCDHRPQQAYVGFRSIELMWIHRCLKPGFQHCFVFYTTPKGIIQVDFMANMVQVGYVSHTDDIERYIPILKRMGMRIVETKMKPMATLCSYLPSLNPNNCVSLTKQLLGVKIPRTFTPWQLYSKLVQRTENKEI